MKTLDGDIGRAIAWMSLCSGLALVAACGGTMDDRAASNGDSNRDQSGWQADDSSNGAGDGSSGGPTPSDTPDDGDSPSSDDEDVANDDSDESDDSDTTDSGLADVCAPRPTSVELPDVPELPERVRKTDCPDFELNTSQKGEPHSRVVWAREDDRITKEVIRGGETQFRIAFHLDESGTVREIDYRTRDKPKQQGGVWRKWEFDDEGRLVKRTHVYKRRRQGDGWDVYSRSETRQTWKRGRLVERVETFESNDNSSRTRLSWSYDDEGRMTMGRAETDDRTYSVHWSYGSKGPTRVEHRLDGETVATRTWTYRSNGHLKRRRSSIVSDNIDFSEIRGALNGHALDQYTLELSRLSGHAPTSSKSSGDECRPLPASLTFGYPTSTPEYRILWKDKGELSRIRELPYRNGRMYYYGSLPYRSGMWYGHNGAITRLPGQSALLAAETGDVELRYDADGHMTEQIVRAEDEVVQRRTRTFEGGKLEKDRLVWTEAANDIMIEGDAEEGPYPHRHVLRFERDERGRMTRRTLSFQGNDVGFQTFDHAESGYVDEMKVHMPNSKGYGTEYPEAYESASLEHAATYRRTLDEQGQPVRFEQDYLVEPRFGRSSVTTFEYNQHGLVARLSRPLDKPKAEDQGVRKFYNNHGRLVRRVDIDNGVMQSAEVWSYADDGRLLERTEQKPDGLGESHTFQYRCTDANK